MKVWRVGSQAVAATVLVGLVLSGCGGGSGSESSSTDAGTPKKGGKLTYAMNTEVPSLDPALCGVTASTSIPIFGTLLRQDPDKNEFVGQMADSFTTSDGKAWTLKLREGVKFSDGTAFDAEAVAFNWDRIKDPKTLSPAARVTKDMTWKVVDPTTVSVTLKSTNYQFPWQLAKGLSMIGSPAAIKAAGADVGNKPVGAGPFTLKKWTRNSQIEYSRNPAYFETGLPTSTISSSR